VSTRVTPAGFRSADATICSRAHNSMCMIIAEGSERTVQRRLLMLSDMLKATAARISGRDLEAEGVAIADAFWQRRRGGERGEGDV